MPIGRSRGTIFGMMRWTLVTAVLLGAPGCKGEPPTCEALMAHANRLYTERKAASGEVDEATRSAQLMLTMRASMCETLSDDQKRCVVASKKHAELESCDLPDARGATPPSS